MVINEQVKQRNDGIELQSNLAAYQVWRLAHLMRTKTLPNKPDNLISTKKNKKPIGSKMDWKMQKSIFEMYNAALGGFDNRKKSSEIKRE
jgi:hypothetical protein